MTAVPGREWRSEQLVEVNQGAALSRGLGRSYGDSSLPSTPDCRVVGTALADRLLHFDPRDGRLRAEAGLSLRSLNQIFLSRGWFPPVTPGTQDVTLGGMVASDVHGKNHHRAGCIGAHVQALLMRVPDGRVMEVSRTRESELFFATLGGMGLTGHILEVELLLESIPSPLIQRRSERFDSLDPLLDALGEAGKSWPFTVAWVDSLAGDEALGRGVLYCGRWATTDEAVPRAPRSRGALRVPFRMPSGLLNRTSIALFNALIYRGHGSKVKQGLVDQVVKQGLVVRAVQEYRVVRVAQEYRVVRVAQEYRVVQAVPLE